jgi:hypothetical protein
MLRLLVSIVDPLELVDWQFLLFWLLLALCE